MDAVRQDIESLRGAIFIKRKLGQGSTFQIKLPLTLAIIEGMLVQVENQIFTIPYCLSWKPSNPLDTSTRPSKNKGR